MRAIWYLSEERRRRWKRKWGEGEGGVKVDSPPAAAIHSSVSEPIRPRPYDAHVLQPLVAWLPRGGIGDGGGGDRCEQKKECTNPEKSLYSGYNNNATRLKFPVEPISAGTDTPRAQALVVYEPRMRPCIASQALAPSKDETNKWGKDKGQSAGETSIDLL